MNNAELAVVWFPVPLVVCSAPLMTSSAVWRSVRPRWGACSWLSGRRSETWRDWAASCPTTKRPSRYAHCSERYQTCWFILVARVWTETEWLVFVPTESGLIVFFVILTTRVWTVWCEAKSWSWSRRPRPTGTSSGWSSRVRRRRETLWEKRTPSSTSCRRPCRAAARRLR